jgi:hypothetical protein
MNKKRLIIASITGAILGVFCIIGANARFGGTLSNMYLFWFWIDRLAMGIILGLLPSCSHKVRLPIRGIVIGLLVSLVFYIATDFTDLTGFLVGGIYGIIIEYVARAFTKDEVCV